GQGLGCRFVGRGGKPEKPSPFPMPPRPVDAHRSRAWATAPAGSGSGKLRELTVCLPHRAAEEGGALDRETPGGIGALGDADAGAGGDRMIAVGREERKGRPVERQMVVGAVDGEGFAELAGAGTELAIREPATAVSHLIDAVGGFECADQYRTAGAAHEVQAPVNAIDLVDIGMA